MDDVSLQESSLLPQLGFPAGKSKKPETTVFDFRQPSCGNLQKQLSHRGHLFKKMTTLFMSLYLFFMSRESNQRSGSDLALELMRIYLVDILLSCAHCVWCRLITFCFDYKEYPKGT